MCFIHRCAQLPVATGVYSLYQLKIPSSLPYIDIHRSLDHSKMTLPSLWILATMFVMYVLSVSSSSAIMDNANSHFKSTRKPLQCHKIKSVDVRCSLECVLHCLKDLYSCAGYVFDHKGASGLGCDVCFIHDVTTPLGPFSISVLERA